MAEGLRSRLSAAADGASDGDRGVSEILGFSLVFTIVITSVVIISIAGMGALEDTRNAEQVNNAERAFDVLADNVADIYRDGAPSRATEMSLAEAQLFTGDNVTVNVTAPGSDPVVHELRPIVYRAKNGATITYEAGAIFRAGESGGTVLKPPPMLVSDERTVLTIVAPQAPNVQGVGSSTVLVRTVERQRTVDVADADGSFTNVYVNVTSPHYREWQTILEERGFGNCVTGTDANGASFVTCSLDPATNVEALYVTTVEMDLSLER